MTNGERHGIGSIIGLWRSRKCKYSANHVYYLAFLGSAVANN